MKAIYAFIVKANHVLFFIAIVGVLVAVSFLVYEEVARDHHTSHVPIVESDGTPTPTIVRDVRLLGVRKEFYIFGVEKREVNGPGSSSRAKRELYRNPSSGESESELVNVTFSKGDSVVRNLLNSDGLVLTSDLGGGYNERARFHVFRCVTEDTNQNHFLDENDRNDLYVVADTLSGTSLILRGASEYQSESDTSLVVKTKEGDQIKFWRVDVSSSSKTEIAWK